MGKNELLRNPVTRIFFKTIDIPVNRSSKISAFRAFKKAGEHIDENKNLVIFPEGGIFSNNYPPRLQQFKPGAFRIAEEKQVPIIPVIIHNAWEILWDDGARLGSTPGRIQVSILAPITPQLNPHENSPELSTLVFEKMEQAMQEVKLTMDSA